MRTRQPGELETDVMRVLWTHPEGSTAGQIRSLIDEPRPALTTVLTVLERLRVKGLVDRTDAPPAQIVFAAAVSEVDHSAQAMLSALNSSSNRDAALLRFAGDLSDRELAMLRSALDSDGAR